MPPNPALQESGLVGAILQEDGLQRGKLAKYGMRGASVNAC